MKGKVLLALRAAAALLALALCALAVSPEARPVDRDAIWLGFLVSAARRFGWIAGPLIGFMIGAGLVAIGALLVLELLRRKREGAGPARRRSPQYLFMILLLLAAYFLVPDRRTEQAAEAATAAAPAPAAASAAAAPAAAPAQAAAGRSRAPAFPAALALGAGLGLAAAIAAALLGRGKPKPQGETSFAESLAAVRRRLELGDGIRDAIIACYAQMCELFAADAKGSASLTAREFAFLLGARGAGAAEIAALTSSFEKARYSGEACTEADREQAVAALLAIEGMQAAAEAGA
jgi:hypothetical protein